MPTVTSGDASIYYEVHGEGPAVAFAHGRGGNAAVWFQQIPHFSGRYKVIVFDHRTFGRSVGGGGNFNQPQLAADLLAILDAEGIEQAALVTQSMGGWTGLGLALAHPERVSCLVLTSTVAGLYTEAVRAKIAEAAGRELPLLERVFSPDFSARNPEMALLYTQIQAFNTGFDPANMENLLDPAQAVDPARLRGYGIPTLFISAGEDRIFPPSVIHLAAGLVPGAAVIDFPGAGHSPYWENPALYNRIVDEFLALHHPAQAG